MGLIDTLTSLGTAYTAVTTSVSDGDITMEGTTTATSTVATWASCTGAGDKVDDLLFTRAYIESMPEEQLSSLVEKLEAKEEILIGNAKVTLNDDKKEVAGPNKNLAMKNTPIGKRA